MYWWKYGAFLNSSHIKVKWLIQRLDPIKEKISRNEVCHIKSNVQKWTFYLYIYIYIYIYIYVCVCVCVCVEIERERERERERVCVCEGERESENGR